jgi:hypothetical protein
MNYQKYIIAGELTRSWKPFGGVENIMAHFHRLMTIAFLESFAHALAYNTAILNQCSELARARIPDTIPDLLRTRNTETWDMILRDLSTPAPSVVTRREVQETPKYTPPQGDKTKHLKNQDHWKQEQKGKRKGGKPNKYEKPRPTPYAVPDRAKPGKGKGGLPKYHGDNPNQIPIAAPKVAAVHNEKQ